MGRRRIYLDYAASTPMDKKVLRTMMPYLKQEYGNPSSSHAFGQAARAAVEEAREEVARLLGAAASEIVFTGGATEANNLAVQGAVRASKKTLPHIVTSRIEHESVLQVCQELEKRGEAEVTYVAPDREGILAAQDVEAAIKQNTALVSVMYANSEVGTVQPVAEIGKRIQKRRAKQSSPFPLFHTDAVQAVSFLECRTEALHADLLTISAHKMYGPKGVGALYIRNGVSLAPLLLGGGQEGGMRSGTENVAAIVGFGAAAKETASPRTAVTAVKIRQLRDKIIKRVPKTVPDTALNGSAELRLASNVNFRVQGVEGRDIVLGLDQKGIAVATGSACSERSQEPSHVLLALGLTREEARSSVRITLGKETNTEEVEKFLKIFPAVVRQLRT